MCRSNFLQRFKVAQKQIFFVSKHDRILRLHYSPYIIIIPCLEYVPPITVTLGWSATYYICKQWKLDRPGRSACTWSWPTKEGECTASHYAEAPAPSARRGCPMRSPQGLPTEWKRAHGLLTRTQLSVHDWLLDRSCSWVEGVQGKMW